MDQPVKSLVNIFIVFLGVFLLITVLTFGIVTNKAEEVLSTVVSYVESVGVNDEVIQNYAKETNTTITVTELDDDSIYASGEKIRYLVSVTYQHIFAWIRYSDSFTIQKATRAIEY